MHDDAPATARWQGGTPRRHVSHADGTQVPTDMPAELGGSGDQVTPGWLFRAGLASCAATSIVLAAAAEGIELDRARGARRAAARTRAACSAWTTRPGSRWMPARADCTCTCGSTRPASRRSGCARWSRSAVRCSPVPSAGAARHAAGAAARHRRRLTTACHGRAVGNPAGRAPGRRHLPPGPLHRALVLPVAQRRQRRAAARARRRAGGDLPPDHRGRVLCRAGRPAAGAPDAPATRSSSRRATRTAWPPSPAWRPRRGARLRRGAVAPAAPARLRRRRRHHAPGLRLPGLRRPPGRHAAGRAAAAGARQRARLERRHLARGLGALRAGRGALAAARRRRRAGQAGRGAVHRGAAPVHERAGRRPHRLAGGRGRPHRRRRAERAAQPPGARLDAGRAGARGAAPRARCWPNASSTWWAARRCST